MIVVFGSLNMDLIFPVDRLPGPGETVLGTRYRLATGGKGANQAAAAAKAGGAARMVGAVGDDDFGGRVVADLAAAGVDTGRVRRTGTPTGCAAIAVGADGENQIVVAGGANLEAEAAAVPESWLTPSTTLLLQLEVRREENWRLLRRAREAGARTILNAAPALPLPEAALGDLDVLIVNEHEMAVLAMQLGLATSRPAEAARLLADRFPITCVVTLGPAGALAAGREGEVQIGALAVNAVDTTGAGDAFTGVFAAASDRELSLWQAIHRASVAGALACTQPGAMPSLPEGNEIEARLADLPPPR